MNVTNPDSIADTQAEAYCSACGQSYPAETVTCPTDGARLVRLAATRDELLGKVLDQRYEIRSPLGKGGMGAVYRGWQLSVDREIAIKVIHPKLSDDRSAVKRFLREARLASRLSQPNIVNVYDFGQSENVLFLVMELLRGQTLGAQVGQGRRLNVRRTITIAAQLCDALEAAHAQGIVHRDLKPSNIVILDDPPGRDLIKVLDFGLAKSLAQDTGSVVTNTDALLGTPLYMSPEQIEGKESDQRADLYSLGCILYEMLTGAPPFLDGAVSAVLARHISDTPAPLPPHVPAKLRALIERLLAKQPEQRIQTAGEIRRILDDIRETPPVNGPGASDTMLAANVADTSPDVSALGETFHSTPVPASGVQSTPSPPPAPAAKSRTGLLAVVFVGAVAATVGVVALMAGKPGQTSRAAAPAIQPAATPVDAATVAADASAPAADARVVVVPGDAAVNVPATVKTPLVKTPLVRIPVIKSPPKARPDASVATPPPHKGSADQLPDLPFAPTPAVNKKP